MERMGERIRIRKMREGSVSVRGKESEGRKDEGRKGKEWEARLEKE